MKKYNIAVMVLDFSGDYSLEILTGIADYFVGKNVNVIMCQVRQPELPYGTFEYQYWAAKSLLSSKSIDAVIVVSTFFTTAIPVSKFIEYLKSFSDRPVISIGVKLPFEKSSCTKTDCLSAYREIVKHLVKEHGCKKIAFMSANKTVSAEGWERFEAFKKSLAENNLKYNQSLLYDGDFTIGSAESALEKFNSKEEIPFDSIIAANDLMAIGCCNALRKIGVSIPGDVKVIGFDDSYRAMNIVPALSTISQQIYNQGKTAAELAYKALTKKQYGQEMLIPLKPVYRQSCGCGFHDEMDSKILEEYIKNSDDKKKMYFLLDVLQTTESLDDLFSRFQQILYVIDIRRMALCMFDEPIPNKKGDEFFLPDEVELAIVLDREHDVEIISPKTKFNPHEKLIPDGIFEDDFDEYILEAIFYGEKQYGYALFKLGRKNYQFGNVYMKTIANAIANAYEFSKKQKENQNLSTLNESLVTDNSKLNATSRTDDMTQLFNRRGFLNAGKNIFDLSHSMIQRGTVIFCDIDGLKTINDTYGHGAGDDAIRGVAEAIRRTFSLNDVVGRVGDDEFAIISVERTLDKFPDTYRMLLENCSEVSKENGYEFSLSVSAGAVEYTSKDVDLLILLNKADREQYREKKRKRAGEAK